MKRIARLLVLSGWLAACVDVAAEGPLQVENAWIRAAPPNTRVLAGYGIFRNVSSDTCVMTGALSKDFKQVEIHRTVMENDIMRMTPQDRLEIKPGRSIAFEPNGYHFMLIGPGKSLRAGDFVTVTLQFENAATQEIRLPVRSAAEHN